jgi:hypothetical protein
LLSRSDPFQERSIDINTEDRYRWSRNSQA